MVKAEVIGRIKPETVVCLRGKYNLYFVEDDKCYTSSGDYIHNDNPQPPEIVYFDEWFWHGDIRELVNVLGIE